jgi:hypothetical protein
VLVTTRFQQTSNRYHSHTLNTSLTHCKHNPNQIQQTNYKTQGHYLKDIQAALGLPPLK